jgi:hypothetical protein
MVSLVGGGGRAGQGMTSGMVDSAKGSTVVVLCSREEHGGNGEQRSSASATRAKMTREREMEGVERQQQLATSLSLPVHMQVGAELEHEGHAASMICSRLAMINAASPAIRPSRQPDNVTLGSYIS